MPCDDAPGRCGLFVGLVLLTGFDVLAQPAAASKRVLLLHSYGQDFAPYSDLSLAFRDELTQKLGEPVDLVEVSLVTAGAGASLEDAPFVDYLQALLVGRKPDLVVPIGGIGIEFRAAPAATSLPGCSDAVCGGGRSNPR